MGRLEQQRADRIEAWLAAGGQVLASSARAARSVAAAYHAARRAEGRLAWQTPAIFAWEEWLRDRWVERQQNGHAESGESHAGRVLLQPLQELSLWKRVIRNRPADGELLHLDRLARAAMRAHHLLADYAPESLAAQARVGWSDDARIFSNWLDDFESLCRRERAVIAARLPWELESYLRGETRSTPPASRQPLLLIGFDRLLPSQRAVLDAWGTWQRDQAADATGPESAKHLEFLDADEELSACVRWLRRRRKEQSGVRLMVVTTRLAERRGELERALLGGNAESLESESHLHFEFSLGTPLAHASPARSALLLLRWTVEPLPEAELDWLLNSGFCAASELEETELAQTMVRVRLHNRERPEWTMDEFCAPDLPELAPPEAWVERVKAARGLLPAPNVRQRPLEWERLAGQALQAAGWPGYRPESSVAYQVRERWQAVLEECAALGFDGSRMSWAEFVDAVAGAVAETIFAAESSDAPIQITEPLTAAGQLADGIWFLGAHEESWPARGQPHPLLPLSLQREMGMPHSSHQSDWELAQEATARLFESAEEVVFSFARHAGEVETRPSRLVNHQAGNPQAPPEELAGLRQTPSLDAQAMVETYEDRSRIPFSPHLPGGGADTLTGQSLCPFQAFANQRLGVPAWEPAEAGLNASQRGQLLHAVLRRIWSGPAEGGLATHAELAALDEVALPAFVRRTVQHAMRESFRPGMRSSLPARFSLRLRELEAERLTTLVTEWLNYERTRVAFTVAATERKAEVAIRGLRLSLRLDRVDRLPDGSELVIDYKSGQLGPSAWRGERPDDLQLPLYATMAMPGDTLEGLLIAQVRPGEPNFRGRLRNAGTSLLNGLKGTSGLVKDPLTDEQLEEWRLVIEGLAEDFLAGNAEVTPKDPARICEQCGLHAICRIRANAPLAALETEDGDEEEGEAATADSAGNGAHDA